jgi:hypothetical protein
MRNGKVEHAADPGRDAGDGAPADRASAPGDAPVVGQGFREAHADGGAKRCGQPDTERAERPPRQPRRGEDRCQGGHGALSRPVSEVLGDRAENEIALLSYAMPAREPETAADLGVIFLQAVGSAAELAHAFPAYCIGIGIMLALRLAMIQSEPAMTRKTISTPNVRARILFVLSGPLPRCRKKTR